MSDTPPPVSGPPVSGPDDDALLGAMWQVVERHGWKGLTMSRLAAASGMPMGELRRRFPCRLDLLRLHLAAVDRAVLEGTVPGLGGSARDRVFDVLMRRVDALQAHRAGVLRFLAEAARDPTLGLAMVPALLNSMAWMLEAAELDRGGVTGQLRAKGLLGVWLATLRAWRQDRSADLGPTMAALDQALDQAERVARTFRLPVGDLAAPGGEAGATEGL
jgi:AcrR family transcriptional regulator